MKKPTEPPRAPRSKRAIVEIKDLAPQDDVKGGAGRWVFGQGSDTARPGAAGRKGRPKP